ncbi:hypothetical protein [Prevotella nigrescens]|uniref:hypothetical protein n=1 Tax=Prevotella nigrescens TaxID=28133 RepID=UPI0028896967|nr:hypothetical protein [Prevotella nigrescens]
MIHFINTFVRLFLVLFHFQLMILNAFKMLEQLGIGRDQTAHGNKSIYLFPFCCHAFIS